MAKLSTILDQIDNGSLLLPEFQRGYVWNREQVRGLMSSVYRAYPVGGFLVWETQPTGGLVRGDAVKPGSMKRLLLDGQQRITSLYGIVRGTPPPFFEGDARSFTGLHFNVEEESFEFYAPAKMQADSRWISVSALFAKGAHALVDPMTKDPALFARAWGYMERLTRLRSVLDRDFHEELITGSDKTVDDVVDIFNRVNSGGTKLSKGDLALAKICADWPEARSALRKHLAEWHGSGYDFSLDWLLRNVNVVATGRAPFSALEQVDPELFRSALSEAAAHVGRFLEAARGRLGLDHDRVLMGRYATPVVTLLLKRANGKFEGAATRDKILFWYVQAAIWGRFAGSTESVLARDYDVAMTGGVDGLIAELEQWRGGNLTLGEHDFDGSTRGSRFYPLLYLLTRTGSAKDFGSGLELRHEMLGKLSSLQIHHIFPKAVLYKHGYSQGPTNAIANFCFLTQDTNLEIGARLPSEYLKDIAHTFPGVLESQWIPTDPELWSVDRYPDFLAARRRLLSAAANHFLAKLRTGNLAGTATILPMGDVPDLQDFERPEVGELVQQLTANGCAHPQLDVEIPDPESGRVLAVAEAFWPDGLQPGLGNPVVLELDPQDADMSRLEALGYEVFTTIEALSSRAELLGLRAP